MPHVMLVDKKGMIAFKGHPAGRPDLAKDLTDMLAGGVLTGKDCAPEVKPVEKPGEEPVAEE